MILNAIFRLVLCPLALLASWVPLTLLWKHNEFPAWVFVGFNWLSIVFVFANAALWHSNESLLWWLGYGWCDLLAFVQVPMATVFSASVCAIMRRLSEQVGLTRVAGWSSRERRNRILVQALIMFPLPVLQVALTAFVQGTRYVLAPVSGCSMGYAPTVISLVFYVLPSPMFTAAALFHAWQTFRKFQQVQSATRIAINLSANSMATSRSNRARRKLYVMMLCVLLPYTPIEAAFLALNIYSNWPWDNPFDFASLRYGTKDWQNIFVLSYEGTSFMQMNISWVSVVAAFVSFVFFGTSKEGVNIYRRYLLFLGLGRVFPKLKDEYDPDRRSARGELSSGRTATTQESSTQNSTTNASTWKTRKDSLLARVGRVGTRSEASLPAATRSTDSVAVPPPPATWLSRFHILRRGSPHMDNGLEETELGNHEEHLGHRLETSLTVSTAVSSSSNQTRLPQHSGSFPVRSPHYYTTFLPRRPSSALRIVATSNDGDDLAIETAAAAPTAGTSSTSHMPFDGRRNSQASVRTEVWSSPGRQKESRSRGKAIETAQNEDISDIEHGGVHVGRVIIKKITPRTQDDGL